MGACEVLLVRHGQTTWNAEGRWQGWADAPLSPLGEAQARAAARHLAGVDAIVTSDLERARRTGAIIGEIVGVGSQEAYRGLRERDVGAFSGLTRPEIEERFPGIFDREPVHPPNGESAVSVVTRVIASLARVAAAHPGRRVLAVSHGGAIRWLERHVGLEPSAVPNLGGRVFRVDGTHLDPGDRLILVDPDEELITVPSEQD